MEPRLTLLTLGVCDLEASVRFYRDGLGWPTKGIVGTEFEDGAVAFFRLAGDLVLALWPREALARAAGIEAGPTGPSAVSLAHNVDSRDELERVMAQAEAAGARVTVPPRDQPWGGAAGYFQDPDGHLWEIAWNPGFDPSAL